MKLAQTEARAYAPCACDHVACACDHVACACGLQGGPMKLAQTEAAVARALAQTGCPPPLSIIPTSSKSKAGRGAVWRLMRDLVLPD